MTCIVGKYEEDLLWIGTGTADNFPLYFKHGDRIKIGKYLTPLSFKLEAGGGSGEGYKFEYVKFSASSPDEIWWGLTLDEDGTIEGIPTENGAGDRRIKVTDSAGNSVEKKFTIAIEEFMVKFKLLKKSIVVPNAVYIPEVEPILTEEEKERHDIAETDYTARVSNGGAITSGGSYRVYVTMKKAGYRSGNVIPSIISVHMPKILIHFDDAIEDSMGNFTPIIHGGEADYTEGHFNRAIELDGTNCITVPMDDTLRINTFYGSTFECWIYPKESGRKQYILGHSYYRDKNNPSSGFALYVGEDGHLWINCDSYFPTKDYDSGYEIKLNQWAHIAVVFILKKVNLYVDGVKKYSVTLAKESVAQPSNAYSLKIGGNSNEAAANDEPDQRYLFNGRIEEFMVIARGDLYRDDTFELPSAPYNF